MSFKNRVFYGANTDRQTDRQTIPCGDDWWKKTSLPAELLLILAQNYETSLNGLAWVSPGTSSLYADIWRTKKSHKSL